MAIKRMQHGVDGVASRVVFELQQPLTLSEQGNGNRNQQRRSYVRQEQALRGRQRAPVAADGTGGQEFSSAAPSVADPPGRTPEPIESRSPTGMSLGASHGGNSN